MGKRYHGFQCGMGRIIESRALPDKQSSAGFKESWPGAVLDGLPSGPRRPAWRLGGGKLFNLRRKSTFATYAPFSRIASHLRPSGSSYFQVLRAWMPACSTGAACSRIGLSMRSGTRHIVPGSQTPGAGKRFPAHSGRMAALLKQPHQFCLLGQEGVMAMGAAHLAIIGVHAGGANG